MIDKGLEVASYFNWISPAIAIAGNVINRGGYQFNITFSACPMSGRELERMFKKHKIRCWGAQIVSDTLMINVKTGEAQRAYGLLQRHDVPVENPPPQQGRKPKRKERAGSPFRVFDEVFGK